ncbi:MAG TPA: zf-HC2 domain-containing protein [Opitutaceae bacterium]|nr:zf-HC2 domain-containing protein [Opitutaceae bacterium]
MNCQRVQDTFLDYQAGTLAAAESAAVREHLKTCLICQREWAGLQETLLQLDRLPPEEPSARLRTNFYAMLDTHLRQAREPSPFALMRNRLDRFFENLVPTRPALQFAFSAVLLVAGVIVGARYLQPAAPIAPPATDLATQSRLDEMQKKFDSMSQLVAYSLAQQQPANTRLQQIAATLARGDADAKTLAGLVSTLAFDPNTNVRLSALEALYAHADRPLVRQGVLASLPRESSPLVQLAMIDFLTSVRDRDAAPAFEALTRDAAIDAAVRDAAQRALVQL